MPPPHHTLKPAWVDDDDDEEYQEHLKKKFTRLVSRAQVPKWAQVAGKEEEKPESDDEDVEETVAEMTRKANSCFIGKNALLFKGALNFSRLRDIGTNQKTLTILKFHPSKPVMITGGQDGVALYDVTTDENYFLQDASFSQFPVSSLELYKQSTALLIGSEQQSYLYSYDLLDGRVTQIDRPKSMPKRCPTGRFAISCDGKYIAIVGLSSEVYVYTAESFEFVHTFVASAKIRTVKFSTNDNSILFALTESGRVYIWDFVRRGSQHYFIDDGVVRGTSMTIGKNDAFIACGSSTGIVNVYKTAEAYQNVHPKPVAIYDNLTTSVDVLAFNHDCQTLAFGSTVKMNAIRMSHTKSGTVFKNFPQRTEMLQKCTVTSAGFSPNSGYFACGTNKGTVRLYRVENFDSY